MVNAADLLRLQRTYAWDQEDWEPTLAQALDGVGPAEAAWRPAGAAGNTIWQTLNHINYYNERILAKLRGEEPPSRPEDGDNDATFGEPGDPTDAGGWEATLTRARRIAADLREALAQLGEGTADLAVWMLHDPYHTGQIILLRKQQGSWPATR